MAQWSSNKRLHSLKSYPIPCEFQHDFTQLNHGITFLNLPMLIDSYDQNNFQKWRLNVAFCF